MDAASDGGPVTDAASGADAAADDTGGSDTVSDVNEADAPPVPPYGFPGDVEDDIEPDVVEDAGPMPEYGAPPEPDAGADVETDMVEDAGPMPEYGAPPEPDAGEEEDASRGHGDADNVPALSTARALSRAARRVNNIAVRRRTMSKVTVRDLLRLGAAPQHACPLRGAVESGAPGLRRGV